MTDYTTLRSQAADLFKAWLQKLVDIKSLDDAQQEYQQATGYITGLNRLGVLNNVQYAAMISLLGSAMDAKKAAPSATNTESDKEKSLNTSLEQKEGAVKPKAIAHIRMELFPNDGLRADINGEGINLSALLASAVMAFRKSGMPEELIRAALDVSMEMAGDSDA